MYETIEEANQAVIAKIVAGSPFLLDVVPAVSVIPELGEGKVLLHAGPPIRYDQMIDPIQGACVGAGLFEGWGETEEEGTSFISIWGSSTDSLSPRASGWPNGGHHLCQYASARGGKQNRWQPSILYDERRDRGSFTFWRLFSRSH